MNNLINFPEAIARDLRERRLIGVAAVAIYAKKKGLENLREDAVIQGYYLSYELGDFQAFNDAIKKLRPLGE